MICLVHLHLCFATTTFLSAETFGLISGLWLGSIYITNIKIPNFLIKTISSWFLELFSSLLFKCSNCYFICCSFVYYFLVRVYSCDAHSLDIRVSYTLIKSLYLYLCACNLLCLWVYSSQMFWIDPYWYL